MASDKKSTSIVTWGIIALIIIAMLPRSGSHAEYNTTQQPTAKNVKTYTKAELQQMVVDAEKRKQVAKEQAAVEAEIETKKQKLLEYFRSGKEPEAQNVMWVDADWFYVAVWNEGGGKQGYAEYVCSIANKMGLNKINVKITDFGQALRSGNVETIATESCK